MFTIAGVVAKNKSVVSTTQRSVIKQMMLVMQSRWETTSSLVDNAHLFCMCGFLDAEKERMELSLTTQSCEITISRGIFGLGTLYWHETPLFVFFSSEIKALFCIEELLPRPDIRGIVENFVYLAPQYNRTCFLDIKRLESAQSVTFNHNGACISDNCAADLCPAAYPPITSNDEFASAIRSQLSNEIAKTSQYATRIAVYLSGGLDSSILLHEASFEFNADALKIFGLTFSDRCFDESAFQRIMVESTNLVDQFIAVNINADCISLCVEPTIADIEFPIVKLNPVSLWYLAKKVSEYKCDLIITGEGADELFWGYDFFEEEFAARNFCSDGNLKRVMNYSITKQIGANNLHYYLEKYHRRDDKLSPLRVRYENSKRIKDFLLHEINETLFCEAEKKLIKKADVVYGLNGEMRDCQWLTMSTLLPEYLITQQSAQIVGNRRLRVCMPFLTERLFHISRQLPEDLLIDEFGGKAVLRFAYKNVLPSQIVNRKKHQLATPGVELLIDSSPELVEKYLSREALERHGIFNYDSVRHLIYKLKEKNIPKKSSALDSMLLTYIFSCQILFSTAKDRWVESA